jgi:TRAP-type mannitol/chloroaromatic compound transport system substrate-binding protein
MDRRSIIKHAGMAGVLAAGVAPAVHAQAAVRWRLASSFPSRWTPSFGSAEMFAKTVKRPVGRQVRSVVHAAGELMPAFGVVDALQNGTSKWRRPPLLLHRQELHLRLWLRRAFRPDRAPDGCLDGARQRPQAVGRLLRQLQHQELQRRQHRHPDGRLVPQGNQVRGRPQGPEDALGGGLFGEAMAKLGVVPQNMPAGDVYQALEKGTLDATEFVGPYDDQKLGFNKVAPSTTTPAGGKAAPSWSSSSTPRPMPRCRREQGHRGCRHRVAARDMTAKYDAFNPIALKKLVADKTQLKAFPRT